jgi:hypothetical protein
MAHARGKIELSLFPFLNILFSLIGVLILYIFMILVMGRASGRASVQAGLERGRAAAKVEDRQLDEMKKKQADLESQVDQKNRELQRIRNEQEQLAQLLELRSRQDTMPAAGTGTVGVPIGAPVPKEWRIVRADDGSGDNRKTPVLVEVTADQYIVYDFDTKGGPPRRTLYPAIGSPESAKSDVPKPRAGRPAARRQADRKPETKADPQPDPGLVTFLNGINRERRDKYLLFLIRPEGIEGFYQIGRYIVQNYPTLLSKQTEGAKPAHFFDFGYEPFSDNWLLVRKAQEPSR